MKLEIYCIANKVQSLCVWAGLLMVTSEDAQIKEKLIVQELPECTKKQAELLAVAKALQSIHPDYRDLEIVLHAPLGYVSAILEKNELGDWLSQAKANPHEVIAARIMYNKYPNISLVRVKYGPELRRLTDEMNKFIGSKQS